VNSPRACLKSEEAVRSSPLRRGGTSGGGNHGKSIDQKWKNEGGGEEGGRGQV